MVTACSDPNQQFQTVTDRDSQSLAKLQEITINNIKIPITLDPQKSTSIEESNIIRQLFEGLTSTNLKGHTVAGIAKNWHTKDNKVWIFNLRKAYWSNGDPVTADDFVYSLRRLVDPKTDSDYASYLADARVVNAQDIIDGNKDPKSLGVKALDDYTLQIQLSEAVPYLADIMIHTAVAPVNKKVVEKFGDKWLDPDNIVVNGAYTIAERDTQGKIILQRNDKYYNNDKTTINKATFLAIGSDKEAISLYKDGKIDYTRFSEPELFFEVLKKELQEQLYTSSGFCTYYYSYDMSKPPFDDIRVRRALSWTINRDVITSNLLGMGQTSAYQYTPAITQGGVKYIPRWRRMAKDKQLALAKQQLREAGYNAQNPLSFQLLYNSNDNNKKIAQIANKMWQQVFGENVIKMTMIEKPWAEYVTARSSKKYSMVRTAWCGDYNEPSSFLNILKSHHLQNIGSYHSQEYDDIMLSTLHADVNDSQRTQLYNKAEEQIDKDAPVIPIYHYVETNLYKPYLKNLSKDNPLGTWLLKDVTIAEHVTNVSNEE